MGRIKTTLIKRVAEDIFNKHENMFKANFSENKKTIEKVAEIRSKKLRNAIAGYLARLVKQKAKAS